MFRTLVGLAALGVGAYIGTQYAAPQVRAWRFRDAMNQTAQLAGADTDDEIRGAVLESARELGVPLPPARLAVRRARDGHFRIRASWDEVVRLRAWKLGEWVDTLHYAHETEGDRGASRR